MKRNYLGFLVLLAGILLKTGSPAYCVTAVEYYNAGLQLYNSKNYSQAIQYFSAAISLEPNHTGALQGRANCYYSLGQTQEALTDYEKVQTLAPSEKLSQFIQALRVKVGTASPAANPALPPINNPPPTSPVNENATSISPSTFIPKRGARIKAGLSLLNFSDFTAHVQASQAEAAYLHNTDPTYGFTGLVPTGAPMIGVEGVWCLGRNFEVGLGVNFIPAGSVKTSFQNGGSVTIQDSFGITAIPLYLDCRYLIGTGTLKPHVSIGFVGTSIGVNYSEGCTLPTYINTANGNFTGFAFGGQAEVGVDWHPAESIAFSPYLCYQIGSGNTFTSTMDIVSGGVTTTGQPVQLYVIPTTNGNVISVVTNGTLVTPVADGNQLIKPGNLAPPGSRPLVIETSGPTAGIQFSYFF